MSRILEILNNANYEDKDFYANNKEDLVKKVTEYMKGEEDEETTINNLIWEGEGLYSIGGKAVGDYSICLTKECEKTEFQYNAFLTLKNDIYVADKNYFDNNDEIAELDEFSMKNYGKHCISEEEYDYRQELKRI